MPVLSRPQAREGPDDISTLQTHPFNPDTPPGPTEKNVGKTP